MQEQQPPPNPNSMAAIGRKMLTYELMTAPIWIVAMIVYGVPFVYFLLVGAACVASAGVGFVLMKQGKRG